jgi:hypothetical protein
MLRCIVRCVGFLHGMARDRTSLPVRDGRGGKGATAVPALLAALHVPSGLPTAEEDLQRLLIDAKVGDHSVLPQRWPPSSFVLCRTTARSEQQRSSANRHDREAAWRKRGLASRASSSRHAPTGSVPTGRGAFVRRRWALPSPRAIGSST